MERTIALGRVSIVYTLLLWSLQGCWGAVTVTVKPKVEAVYEETVTLPCSFKPPSPVGNSIVEWFIEDGGSRKRVAFRAVTGENGGTDEGTRLSGRVSIAKNYSLSISPVTLDDERRFHCQVTAGASGAGEAATELKVFFPPEKPVVTDPKEPISVGKKVSSEVAKCVSRNGFPTPRIIWYKNLQPLPEVKDHKEPMYMTPSVVKEASGLFTVSSTLFLQAEKKDKNAKFKCTVEYSIPGGQIRQLDSDTFSWDLLYPTEHVTFQPETSGPIKEGDDVTMICNADGNPKPAFVFTFIDKENKEVSLQGSNGVLTLPSVTRADNGKYRCEALDFDAKDVDLVKEFTLFVHYLDPVTIIPSGPMTIPLGENVQVQCRTRGSDSHTIVWNKGETVLSTSGILSLNSVSYSDAGVYSCRSSVPSVPGLRVMGTVIVTVSGKPMIMPPEEATVQKVGDMVTLACSAQGHPTPQFAWTSAGKEAIMLEDNKVVSTISLEATEAILQGGVTCEASNEHGKDTQLFKVVISKDTFPDTFESIDNEADRADRQQGGATLVVVVVVVCVLLLLLLVVLLFCLQKTGRLPCGKEDKKEIVTGDVKNDIVVEMKSDKANEEAELLNKRLATEQ